jgi:hypothetical protein
MNRYLAIINIVSTLACLGIIAGLGYIYHHNFDVYAHLTYLFYSIPILLGHLLLNAVPVFISHFLKAGISKRLVVISYSITGTMVLSIIGSILMPSTGSAC